MLQVGNLALGGAGSGDFNQSQGTLNADAITIDAGGYFSLTGGVLNTTSINLLAGTFFQSSDALGSLKYATFVQDGGNVQGILENRGTYTYNGGTFSGRLYNYGTVNLFSSGNTFTAENGMSQLSTTPVLLEDLEGGANLILKGQGLEVDQNATFTQTGGYLNTSQSIIGNTGSGTFNQTGGKHEIDTDLILGKETDGNGAYSLKGGDLSSNNTYIGYNGQGSFEQDGESGHNVANNLVLGQEATGSGSYTLNNGQLSTTNTYVGYNGRGTFEQNGGSHQVAKKFDPGPGKRGSGTYKLMKRFPQHHEYLHRVFRLGHIFLSSPAARIQSATTWSWVRRPAAPGPIL